MVSVEQLPSVALVILTWNQKDTTLKCLESLKACDYTNLTVILVDNGSEDGTSDCVIRSYPNVVLLRNEENEGASAGRNTGIEYANMHISYSYIMFIDNDTEVRPDFLTKLVESLETCEDSRVQIASPMIYQIGTEKTIDSAGGSRVNFFTGSTQTRGHGELDKGQYQHKIFSRSVPTTAVILHKKAMERAGSYDVSFDPYGYEDLDMVLRANKKNTPYLFVPNSIVYHLGSRTGFKTYSNEYAATKGKNMRRFFKRHSTPFQWVCFNVLLPFLSIKTIARELSKGNVRTVWALAKGFFRGL